MATNSAETGRETVRWSAYPSWAHFTWLYAFSLLAGARGLLLVRLDVSGWEAWVGGAAMLLGGVAVMRRWAQYILTSRRIIVKNGYTGREIQALALDTLPDLAVEQGPIARFFEIGTIVIRSLSGDQIISLRGVRDPEVIKARIEALRPAPPRQG